VSRLFLPVLLPVLKCVQHQLLTPSRIIAQTAGREEISAVDVEEVRGAGLVAHVAWRGCGGVTRARCSACETPPLPTSHLPCVSLSLSLSLCVSRSRQVDELFKDAKASAKLLAASEGYLS